MSENSTYVHDDPEMDKYLHLRATKSPLARLINRMMPSDPRPVFVPFAFAHASVFGLDGKRAKRRLVKLYILAAVILAATLGIISLLIQVPGLRFSILTLLITGLEQVMPTWAAIVITVVACGAAQIALGSFYEYNSYQKELNTFRPASNGFYNFWLKSAMYEEMIFRAGGHKWSWLDRARASAVFGFIHVFNMFYPFGAVVALMFTGFGLMLVYLWEYRRTGSEVEAVSLSAVVHALYNTLAVVLLAVVLIVALASVLITSL